MTKEAASDEWRAYPHHPYDSTPVGSGTSSGAELFLPPNANGGRLMLDPSGPQNVGALHFELTSSQAVLVLKWDKDISGNPIPPLPFDFVPKKHVNVFAGSGFHTAIFDRPDEEHPYWSWDIVTGEPAYTLTVTVKRK